MRGSTSSRRNQIVTIRVLNRGYGNHAPSRLAIPHHRGRSRMHKYHRGINPEIAEELRLAGMHLRIGDSLRRVCPFCRAVHENSLRLTRKVAALTFNCFRASCGARGAIQSNGGTQLHSFDTERRTKSNPFTLETCSPPEGLVELLGSRYGISPEVLHYSGMKWAERASSMCFPVFDIDGNKTGTTTKVLGELNGKRKATVYYDDEPPPYYTMRKFAARSRVCWLVEDVLSCLRLFSEGATSIALLGTNVSHRLFTALPLYFQKVVIALDPDALAKALKLQQELSILPCTTEVVAFSKDPKDVPREELLAQLEIHGT